MTASELQARLKRDGLIGVAAFISKLEVGSPRCEHISKMMGGRRCEKSFGHDGVHLVTNDVPWLEEPSRLTVMVPHA